MLFDVMMIELSVIRDLVAIFGVIAGFTYYVMTVRNSQRMQKMQFDTRQAELYMRLWEKWNTKEFSEIRFDVWSMRKWENLDDFIEQYHPVVGSHPEARHLFASWRTFDRTIGGLAELRRKNLIEIDFLDGMMIHDIYNWWWTFGQLIYESLEKGSLLSEGEYVPFIKEVIDYDRIRRPGMFEKDSGEPREPNDPSIERPWIKLEDVIELRKKVYH